MNRSNKISTANLKIVSRSVSRTLETFLFFHAEHFFQDAYKKTSWYILKFLEELFPDSILMYYPNQIYLKLNCLLKFSSGLLIQKFKQKVTTLIISFTTTYRRRIPRHSRDVHSLNRGEKGKKPWSNARNKICAKNGSALENKHNKTHS